MGGGVGGGDGHARDVLVGGRAAASRMPRPAPRMAQGLCPHRWTQLWESPLSRTASFFFSCASALPRCPFARYMIPIAGSTRGPWFALAPHRERPLPAQGLISTPAPDLSFPQCAHSIVKWVALRTPRVPARPPSADPSGTRHSWVGRTALALRTRDHDFRGPVCDALGTGM